MKPSPASSMRIDLANLTPIAREFIATSIALFTDPAPLMQAQRDRILAGQVAITVEGDEVTWVEPHQD
jgi:hypothetical protein